jgi:hypothetical protein
MTAKQADCTETVSWRKQIVLEVTKMEQAYSYHLTWIKGFSIFRDIFLNNAVTSRLAS